MNLPRMRESCTRLKEPGGLEWKEPHRRSFTEEYKRQAVELAVWRRRSHRRPKRARICMAQCCGAECRTPDMSSRSIKDRRNAQSGATICAVQDRSIRQASINGFFISSKASSFIFETTRPAPMPDAIFTSVDGFYNLNPAGLHSAIRYITRSEWS